MSEIIAKSIIFEEDDFTLVSKNKKKVLKAIKMEKKKQKIKLDKVSSIQELGKNGNNVAAETIENKMTNNILDKKFKKCNKYHIKDNINNPVVEQKELNLVINSEVECDKKTKAPSEDNFECEKENNVQKRIKKEKIKESNAWYKEPKSKLLLVNSESSYIKKHETKESKQNLIIISKVEYKKKRKGLSVKAFKFEKDHCFFNKRKKEIIKKSYGAMYKGHKGELWIEKPQIRKGRGNMKINTTVQPKNINQSLSAGFLVGHNYKSIPEQSKKKKVKVSYKESSTMHKEISVKNRRRITLIEGVVKIHSHSKGFGYYVSVENKDDIFIKCINGPRPLNGDIVIVQVHNGGSNKRPKGSIISIKEEVHCRKAIGFLTKADGKVIFKPRDPLLPKFEIDPLSLENIRMDKEKLGTASDVLFLARMTSWEHGEFANGEVERLVGKSTDLKAEKDAILMENDLHVAPYKKKFLKGLPNSNYTFKPIDLLNREEWRKKCIFTIDPSTAVDLDDAVSCYPLRNGNFEIGVHISDVTHFLQSGTRIDSEIAKRAVTYYMVDKAYHMLPEELCKLCSLLPGKDKVAFSIIWEMTPDAEIVSHRFAKTIINSCCQMSYEEAQEILEMPEVEWLKIQKLDVKTKSKKFYVLLLYRSVKNLFHLSQILRKKRFDKGALKFDQLKMQITLDELGLPVSLNVEGRKDSNNLIEEFMLLANTTVATHLYNLYPETALLRCHEKPIRKVLGKTKNNLEQFGININIDTAASLNSSIDSYETHSYFANEKFNELTQYRMMVINNLFLKSMKRAKYTCSSVKKSKNLHHYALNVDFYTHFTSPMRRYADVAVHRLLYASILNRPLPKGWNSAMCSAIANNCNVKKYAARIAQEKSIELYFAYLIHLNESIIAAAIVADINEHCMDVLLVQSGIKLNIQFQHYENNAIIHCDKEYSIPTITIEWKDSAITQAFTLFSILNVKVQKCSNSMELQGTLISPT
ncbi:DIS3-like exonuclease 2 [Prorops nasuta]|uniref:DIS3-like exonuclease 2 n=1 Tax=Prorops nasuta TaxID=863751 RepID=UPI0034CFBFFA